MKKIITALLFVALAFGCAAQSKFIDINATGTVAANNIRMTNGASNGKVATSDTAGNVSWQTASGGSFVGLTNQTLQFTNHLSTTTNGWYPIILGDYSMAGTCTITITNGVTAPQTWTFNYSADVSDNGTLDQNSHGYSVGNPNADSRIIIAARTTTDEGGQVAVDIHFDDLFASTNVCILISGQNPGRISFANDDDLTSLIATLTPSTALGFSTSGSVNVGGTVTAGVFSGDGSQLINVQAATLDSGGDYVASSITASFTGPLSGNADTATTAISATTAATAGSAMSASQLNDSGNATALDAGSSATVIQVLAGHNLAGDGSGLTNIPPTAGLSGIAFTNATIDFGSIGAGLFANSAVDLINATTNMAFFVSPVLTDLSISNMNFMAFCSTNGTVRVRAFNHNTINASDPPSTVFNIFGFSVK